VRVLELLRFVVLGCTPLWGAIVGWISEHMGPRYAVAVGALAALGAGAWGLVRARSCEPAAPLSSDEAVTSVEAAIAELDDDVTDAEHVREPVAGANGQGTRTVLPTS
jgi:hypothetical protein